MDIQDYVLNLLEAECEQRGLALVVSLDCSNNGTAYAMRATETISRFSFDFQPERISVVFEGASVGLDWSNYQKYDEQARRRHGSDGLWRNRYNFSLDQKEAFDAMLTRWRELLQ